MANWYERGNGNQPLQIRRQQRAFFWSKHVETLCGKIRDWIMPNWYWWYQFSVVGRHVSFEHLKAVTVFLTVFVSYLTIEDEIQEAVSEQVAWLRGLL